ncbi:hypothetical protein CFOL_v3_09650 [Cephalotus follicularis]|uniref:Retrotransposon gag domain-containing protein n=1 Tax=Cephalotus follicularis TaxID=3775 RepID=A0A1Q3BDQ4_CEPFO|nr:hypothetical protein CFOL_v3_09650 [Cephalotus follicularis]
MFLTKFLNSTTQRKNSSYLINVVQGKNESLRDYLTQFNKESLMVKDMEPSFTLATLNSGLTENSAFPFSLMKKPALDMTGLLRRVEKYINAEEALQARKQKTSWSDHQKRKWGPELTEDDLRHKLSKRENSPKRGSPIPNYKSFAPLLETRTRILVVEKEKVPIQWPPPLRIPVDKRDSSKYCRYHRDHGHDMEDYRQLKNQIEDLIRKGHPRKYVNRDAP